MNHIFKRLPARQVLPEKRADGALEFGGLETLATVTPAIDDDQLRFDSQFFQFGMKLFTLFQWDRSIFVTMQNQERYTRFRDLMKRAGSFRKVDTVSDDPAEEFGTVAIRQVGIGLARPGQIRRHRQQIAGAVPLGYRLYSAGNWLLAGW